jgi:hypothetical protein
MLIIDMPAPSGASSGVEYDFVDFSHAARLHHTLREGMPSSNELLHACCFDIANTSSLRSTLIHQDGSPSTTRRYDKTSTTASTASDG